MITIIGLGFVGLTTALGFSRKGYKVYGYDISNEKMNCLKNNKIPFYEPYLGRILKDELNNRFYLTTDTYSAVNDSEIIIFCVGTPCDENGDADLAFLENAVQDTIAQIKKGDYKVLAIKSTVPPGTTKEKIIPLIESHGFNVGKDIGVVNNPEFLREGSCWEDFIKPDRIVIGQSDSLAGETMANIYEEFNAPVYRVTLNTGEYIKYLSNTLLSTMISFANEMSMLADGIGDISLPEAFHALHKDKRWSGHPAQMTSYVYPGCGFGGYCLPKDTSALCSLGTSLGCDTPLLKSVLKVNENIKKFTVEQIAQRVDKKDYIGILGLSFKPDSDDVRDTPAAIIIEKLLKRGYPNIIAYDPVAMNEFQKSYALPLTYADSFEELVEKTSFIAILTGWKEFKDKKIMFEGKTIFDFRNYLNS